MYTALYESMLAWYARTTRANDRVRHWYAVTTMTSMGFVNLWSIIAVLAYQRVEWAQRIFWIGQSWTIWMAVFFGLLAAHLLYFRIDRGTPKPRLPWVALAYIVLSVVAVLYSSDLVAFIRKPGA